MGRQPWTPVPARTGSAVASFSQEQRFFQDLLSSLNCLCPWRLTCRKLNSVNNWGWTEPANLYPAPLQPGPWQLAKASGAGPAIKRLKPAESLKLRQPRGSSGFNPFRLNQGQKRLETPNLQLYLPSQDQGLADKNTNTKVQSPPYQIQARPIGEHLPSSSTQRAGGESVHYLSGGSEMPPPPPSRTAVAQPVRDQFLPSCTPGPRLTEDSQGFNK